MINSFISTCALTEAVYFTGLKSHLRAHWISQTSRLLNRSFNHTLWLHSLILFLLIPYFFRETRFYSLEIGFFCIFGELNVTITQVIYCQWLEISICYSLDLFFLFFDRIVESSNCSTSQILFRIRVFFCVFEFFLFRVSANLRVFEFLSCHSKMLFVAWPKLAKLFQLQFLLSACKANYYY